MTSVYQQEKIYPNIPATAPPDDESYRLKKIDELEKFLRTEVESRDKPVSYTHLTLPTIYSV